MVGQNSSSRRWPGLHGGPEFLVTAGMLLGSWSMAVAQIEPVPAADAADDSTIVLPDRPETATGSGLPAAGEPLQGSRDGPPERRGQLPEPSAEPAALPDGPVRTVGTPPAGGESPSPDQRELRRQSALAGLLVLGLVCIVFLTLIVGVVLWARRMRRLTGQPLPEQHPGDPLWYLRKRTTDSDRSDVSS